MINHTAGSSGGGMCRQRVLLLLLLYLCIRALKFIKITPALSQTIFYIRKYHIITLHAHSVNRVPTRSRPIFFITHISEKST